MTIKEFYDKLSNIIEDYVFIYKESEILYEGFLNEKRVYAYLMNERIERIYGSENGIVVEICC